VTPKDRERAYEKRRYEEWQERLAAKQARNRRARRTSIIVGSALLTVFVIGGLFLVLKEDDDSSTTANPASTPSAGATPPSAEATPSAAAEGAGKNPCPAPNVKPPAKPKSFKAAPPASEAGGKNWTFTLKTTCGTVAVELDGKKAPQAVSAMLMLGKAGFFDGSPCHRLVDAGIFVLQCGDPTGTGTGGPGFEYGPVENAPKGDLYKAGTVAMARQGGNGKSMGSQFFLVYKDSTIPSDAAGGYTVLGKITKGMDVVDKVAAGKAKPADQTGNTAPNRPVSIVSTTVSAG
jgi:peptidyl-prolyl cis-trans isomerase B (cyclophilin B)